MVFVTFSPETLVVLVTAMTLPELEEPEEPEMPNWVEYWKSPEPSAMIWMPYPVDWASIPEEGTDQL